jgi:hypothetical protein
MWLFRNHRGHVRLISLTVDGTDAMLSRDIKRRFGCWLLGLFLIAQLGGVAPLIALHLQHISAAEQDSADDAGDSRAAQHAHRHHVHQGGGHHDHGAADPNDQCCTVHHHLAGVLPFAVDADTNDLSLAAIVSLRPRAFVSADPRLLERPPKLLSSI